MTAVQHVIIQMDPTPASVTAAIRGMEEPVEVQARTRIQSALNKHSKKALIIQSSAVHLTAKN